MSKPYKLLIKGELVQRTAFSTIGPEETDSPLDMPMAKNGKGELTLRGSSLAGAFIATARELFDKVPDNISEGTPSAQVDRNKNQAKPEDLPRMKESVWIFHNAHPVTDAPALEIRDNVAISQKSGAARHGAKFDGETVPADTRWHFLLEVDRYRDQDDDTACGIALAVAKRWRKCCWLGRDVARGLGWMQLENIEVYELDADDALQWPNAQEEPIAALRKLTIAAKESPLEGAKEPDKTLHEANGTITIEVNPETGEDSWGLDFLSVGGSNGQRIEGTPGKDFLRSCNTGGRLTRPLGQTEESYLRGQNPDDDINFRIATTHNGSGEEVPHIPGSSLRGPMRHALSWQRRRNGKTVWEPGERLSDSNDEVTNLFGSTRDSAQLLIGDALLTNNEWQALVLEMHAEDEFAGGVYGSGKFDRTCLVKGCFQAPWHLQAPNEQELKASLGLMSQLKTLADSSRIPIGGGQWKGLGWVKLDIQLPHSGQEENHD